VGGRGPDVVERHEFHASHRAPGLVGTPTVCDRIARANAEVVDIGMIGPGKSDNRYYFRNSEG
jgi:hypothetical protein